ncbi:MAG: cytochrome c [Proteobacteria bacterium]|nr:cytochrome c [Pseudomonadota bacterium]
MFSFYIKILTGVIIVSFTGLNAFGGDLKYEIAETPAEYLDLENPYTSQADLKKGEELYQDKCGDCHGIAGEGDDEGAVVFNNKKYMQSRSDGQLFYISLEGNGEDATMEAWGPDSDYGLSEKKLWQMISYIRQLAK